MRIALTGSSGKLGTVVARELRAAGHEVIGLDVRGERGPGFVQVELTDYGQVIDALAGVNDQHDGVDIPQQHDQHVQRVLGGRAAGDSAHRVRVE